MKTCTKCQLLKPFSDFGKKISYVDGLQYWCKVCIKDYKKCYYINNLDKSKKERLEWRKKNHHSVSAYTRAYYSRRYQQDPIFRIIKNQRNRLKEIITNKPTSFTKSIGCGSNFLKSYLESKFQPGMTWKNYGQWHIDHIRPLSSFNLLDKEQFKQACHYTNLQPLWAKENRIKSNKWENN